MDLGNESHDNNHTGGKCSKCGFAPLTNALCFTSNENGSKVTLTKTSSVYLQYTTSDGYSWTDFSNNQTITLNRGSKLYVHATSTNATLDGCQFKVTGSVEADGELSTLINREGTNTLPNKAFYALFKGSSGLTKAPKLSADKLGVSCYESLFEGCTTLTSAPTLPATTLTEKCYCYMFKGCTKLTSAPTLNATSLAASCYQYMFDQCNSLNLPAGYKLPATTLKDRCYWAMFRGCSKLTNTPIVAATTLASGSCAAMFEETGLTKMPELRPTVMTEKCYAWMFQNCKSLKEVQQLPATTLATSCYDGMFSGCSELTEAPYLPATTLKTSCYNSMFKGCSKLNFVAVAFNYWGSNCTNDWLSGVANSGVLVSPSTLPTSTRGASTIPSNWVANPDFLCFTAQDNGATIQLQKKGSPKGIVLKYSTNRYQWYDLTVGSTKITLNNGQKVYFKAKDYNSTFSTDVWSYYCFASDKGKKIAVSGNVMSLLDQCCVTSTVPDYAFTKLFEDNKALISGPELPSTKVGQYAYAFMFNGCTSLNTAPKLPATTLDTNCYAYMFSGCESLTQSPELKVTKMADACYYHMFHNCPSLVTAPQLPATELAFNCYAGMFFECTSLKTAPQLPATKLDYDCYNSMFYGCTSLTTAPELPASQLSQRCYFEMFNGCTSLNFVAVSFSEWKEDATKNWLKGVSKEGLFLCPDGLEKKRGDSNIPTNWVVNPDYLCFTAEEANSSVLLKKDGEQESIGLEYSSDRIHWNDFIVGTTKVTLSTVGEKFYLRAKGENETLSKGLSGCYHFKMEGKVAASGNVMSLLDAKMTRQDVPDYAFAQLFLDCGALTTAPKLPATKVGKSAYHFMFEGCENLTSAPALPATELGDCCYMCMFRNCKSLATAPELPATALANECYREMFNSCSSLTKAPKLPATSLVKKCYSNMFKGCSSLTEAPVLPATQLADYCYYHMFKGCTSLTEAPALPATQLADYCYANMFNGCTSLTEAPALQATQLKQYCYDDMFFGCTSLTEAPTLPATQLATGCYNYMFDGCTALKTVSVAFTEWNTSATENWLSGVSKDGLFLCPDALEEKRGADFIPEGWTVNPDYLCFTAEEENSAVSMSKIGNPNAIALEYSTDHYTWSDFFPNTTEVTLSNVGDKVYLRAKGKNQSFSKGYEDKYSFALTGKVAASGNVMSLLDASLERTSLNWFGFADLFRNCSALTSAPSLPATKLASNCYSSMFEGCTALTEAPALPATQLEISCYNNMFEGCTSLTKASALPATQLVGNCYNSMFKGCTALTEAPALPATQLAKDCYESMFEGCTALTEAPALPATQLAKSCYQRMFEGCTVLTEAPALPATQLEDDCYSGMFQGCTSLKTAPELPATELAYGCYAKMFADCSSLSGRSIYLPATTLADHCYEKMLAGTAVNECILPATELKESCYRKMFSECQRLQVVTVAFSDWRDDLHATQGWLTGAGNKNPESIVSNAICHVVCPEALPQEEGRLPESIEYNTYTTKVKLNASGYATYSSPVWQTVVEGAKIAACEITPEAIVLHELPFIMNGDELVWGYLLVGEPNAEVTLQTILNPEEIEDITNKVDKEQLFTTTNHLQATTAKVASLIPRTFADMVGSLLQREIEVYALNGNKFKKYVGESFVHGKAYLANFTILEILQTIKGGVDVVAPKGPTYSAVEQRRIVWDYELENETTSISQVRTERETPAFNLNGQRSFQNHGLQIRNGKVVLNK